MSQSSAPKRILHIIDTLSPAAGGPTESVVALLEFAPQGYAGEVVTLDEPASPFLAGYPFPVHALGRGSTALGYSSNLDRWLRANRDRFDGAIVHGLWRYISFAAWRAFRGRTPYLVFTHGMLDPYFKRSHPLKHMAKWLYWLLSEYWVLRGAHRTLFTTSDESRLARQSFWLHRWHGTILPIGAKRPPADEATLTELFHTSYPALRDQRFILFLGRIHRKKGCDLLIRSFVRLAASDPALHLVMAGPDQQRWSAELKQIVTDAALTQRVHWPGMLHGELKWGAITAGEAFILPSHQENFGIAVAEALACGRPVLLADKVNIAPEIAADGAGLMQPDTQAGTDALLQSWIAMPPQQRSTMRTAALACFNQRYDMRTNAATILHLFEDVPPRNPRSDLA